MIVVLFLKKVFSNRWVRMAFLGVLILALGYAFGRYATPAKVVTTEKIVTKVETKIVYQDRVVTKVVKVRVRDQSTHTETTTTKTPDGTTTTKTVTDTKVDTKVDTNIDKTDDKTATKVQTATKSDDKTKTVDSSKASWRVGAELGLSIPSTFLGEPQLGVPGLRGAVIGVSAERRIFGPLWFGLHGNTQGTVSLGLSGEF